MRKIKSELIILGSIILVGLIGVGIILAQTDNPLKGRIIALDAGHGDGESGAVYQCQNGGKIYEKDVNLTIVYVLRSKLLAAGAEKVILTRVDDSEDSSNRERCDRAKGAHVLLGIHHNASENPLIDGTETYYTQPDDYAIAEEEYNALLSVFGPGRGIKKAAYGMTVLCKMPSTLTEAYFLTNPTRGEAYCGVPLEEYNNVEQTQMEAQTLYDGLVNYFIKHPEDGGPGKKPK